MDGSFEKHGRDIVFQSHLGNCLRGIKVTRSDPQAILLLASCLTWKDTAPAWGQNSLKPPNLGVSRRIRGSWHSSGIPSASRYSPRYSPEEPPRRWAARTYELVWFCWLWLWAEHLRSHAVSHVRRELWTNGTVFYKCRICIQSDIQPTGTWVLAGEFWQTLRFLRIVGCGLRIARRTLPLEFLRL